MVQTPDLIGRPVSSVSKDDVIPNDEIKEPPVSRGFLISCYRTII